MELKTALKEQYHAGLAMLSECIDKCPDDVWASGTYPREFWKIAWHTLFFAHNYLVAGEEEFNASFNSWPKAIRERLTVRETQLAVEVEPYELPEGGSVLSQAAMLDYLRYVDGMVDSLIDSLDLESDSTGFSWYSDMSKLSHSLMNLRHIQGHVGQLSELLMARDIDIDWVGKA